MEKEKMKLNAFKNGITGFLGDFKIEGRNIVNGFLNNNLTVKEYLLTISDEKKIVSSLKMVMYSENINLSIKELSLVNRKKIQLAYSLLKKDKVIFLDNFEKGMNNKEKIYFKKLFKKLKTYEITLIVCTNDLSFMIDNVDRVCLVKNDIVMKILEKNNWYNDELSKYTSIPKIIQFVKYCNKFGILLDNYTDCKELMKAIFRVMS